MADGVQVPSLADFEALEGRLAQASSPAVGPQGPPGPQGPAGPAGPGGSSAPVYRRLSEFSSSTATTDDTRLAAFASYAAAQTYRGIMCLLDEPRAYTFTKPVTIYPGFSLVGPGRPVDQARSSMPIPNKVVLNMTGGWLRLPGSEPGGRLFGSYIGGLSIEGSTKARVFEPNKNTVLWTTTLRDLGIQNIASLLGSRAVMQPVDFLCMDGFWNFNNVQECAWNIGGSDCFLRLTGMNLDTQPSFLPVTEFMALFTAFGVSSVSDIYWTCEQHSAIKVSAQNEGALRFSNCVIEGRNASQPCFGSLVRIEGGDVQMRDCTTHYAMSNPKATGRDDAGVIHITGGNVQILGNQYRRAAGVAPTVPYIYVSGGNVRIRDIQLSGRDTWGDQLPVVKWVGGTVNADDSVRVDDQRPKTGA